MPTDVAVKELAGLLLGPTRNDPISFERIGDWLEERGHDREGAKELWAAVGALRGKRRYGWCLRLEDWEMALCVDAQILSGPEARPIAAGENKEGELWGSAYHQRAYRSCALLIATAFLGGPAAQDTLRVLKDHCTTLGLVFTDADIQEALRFGKEL